MPPATPSREALAGPRAELQQQEDEVDGADESGCGCGSWAGGEVVAGAEVAACAAWLAPVRGCALRLGGWPPA